MTIKEKKITYVFTTGRSARINDNNFSKEFFYSYDQFIKNFKFVELIEMKQRKTFFSKFLNFIDIILRKMTKCSFYTSTLCTYKNFLKIYKSDVVILTNDRLAFSILPMLIISKAIKPTKKKNVIVITMGIIKNTSSYLIVNKLNSLFTKLLILFTNNFIFLSKSEHEKFKLYYPKISNFTHYIPYCTDTNFWKSKNVDKDIDILFIGNDGKRDYRFVETLFNSVPNLNCYAVSQHISKNLITNKNFDMSKSSWHQNILSDLEIRDIYDRSKIVVIPLINSYQPSGQSVTLQSLSMGTPTLITETKGFWDYDKFINYENIVFLENNAIDLWRNEIDLILNNKESYNKIRKQGMETVYQNFNLQIFYKKLIEIVENE